MFLVNRISHNSGIGRYVRSLYTELVSLYSDLNFFLYSHNNIFSISNIGKIKAISDVIHESYFMDHNLNMMKCDLFHCTKNFGIPRSNNYPVITTVHDIIPLSISEYSKNIFYKYYNKYNYINTFKKSKLIITISNFSLKEIVKYDCSLRRKIFPITLGCDAAFYNKMSHHEAKRIMNRLGVENKYILTMGGAEPRKNVEMLVSIFDEHSTEIPYDLVVIGSNWSGYKISLPQRRRNAFHCFSRLSDLELAAAYKAATVFVFPSIYEGFGLPVLEAMACGTPVLAHNGTSIPEVAGSAAILVDMTDPNECLKGISRLLSERSLRDELRQAGLERVKMFTWEKTAAETLEVYKSVLS